MGRVVFDVFKVFTRLTHENDCDDDQTAHHNDANNRQVTELLHTVMISLKSVRKLVRRELARRKLTVSTPLMSSMQTYPIAINAVSIKKHITNPIRSIIRENLFLNIRHAALDLSINLHRSIMKMIVDPMIDRPETITMIMLNHPKKNPKVSNGTQPRNEFTLHMFHVMIEQQFVYLEEC